MRILAEHKVTKMRLTFDNEMLLQNSPDFVKIMEVKKETIKTIKVEKIEPEQFYTVPEMREILEKSLKEISYFIGTVKDMDALKQMRIVEKNGKNRKSIMKQLDNLIS